MDFQLLDRTGLRVSDFCLGTMTFGDDLGWGAAKDEARKVYEAFREAGGNFVDTANIYTNGTSETFLGEFFVRPSRRGSAGDQIYECTRGRSPESQRRGNQRKSMVDASLRRLKTDYIDF